MAFGELSKSGRGHVLSEPRLVFLYHSAYKHEVKLRMMRLLVDALTYDLSQHPVLYPLQYC